MVHISEGLSMYTLQTKYKFFHVLLEIARPWRTFLKNEISYCQYMRKEMVCSSCINFVEGPSSFTNSFNKISPIEINLQTSCLNWEA